MCLSQSAYTNCRVNKAKHYINIKLKKNPNKQTAEKSKKQSENGVNQITWDTERLSSSETKLNPTLRVRGSGWSSPSSGTSRDRAWRRKPWEWEVSALNLRDSSRLFGPLIKQEEDDDDEGGEGSEWVWRKGCVSDTLEMNTKLERDSIGEQQRDIRLKNEKKKRAFSVFLLIKKQKGFLVGTDRVFVFLFYLFINGKRRVKGYWSE